MLRVLAETEASVCRFTLFFYIFYKEGAPFERLGLLSWAAHGSRPETKVNSHLTT
jgi:hypothetical protein